MTDYFLLFLPERGGHSALISVTYSQQLDRWYQPLLGGAAFPSILEAADSSNL